MKLISQNLINQQSEKKHKKKNTKQVLTVAAWELINIHKNKINNQLQIIIIILEKHKQK